RAHGGQAPQRPQRTTRDQTAQRFQGTTRNNATHRAGRRAGSEAPAVRTGRGSRVLQRADEATEAEAAGNRLPQAARTGPCTGRTRAEAPERTATEAAGKRLAETAQGAQRPGRRTATGTTT